MPGISDTVHESAFPELLLSNTPLLDVRAPIEFSHGAFPSATNIPLLDDEQREAVGKRYKQSGREAAIALGNDLLDASKRQQLISRWLHYLDHNPGAIIYCFRGGLRSQTSQQWLQEEGHQILRIEGGYKALRRYLIDLVDSISGESKFIIVAGKTGSGKTHLINQLSHSVDLEGCARHRGSAFGRRVQSQPSQLNFENQLSIDLLKLEQSSPRKIFLEDESHAIGSVSLPESLYKSMKQSPIAVLEETLEARVSTILDDYIASNLADYQKTSMEQSQDLFSEFLLSSLGRIRRRLGEENYVKVESSMKSALKAQLSGNGLTGHRQWIETLLTQYYDPMYDYQLEKKSRRVIFRGDRTEFLDWSAHLTHPANN